jgi:hypothetical protein
MVGCKDHKFSLETPYLPWDWLQVEWSDSGSETYALNGEKGEKGEREKAEKALKNHQEIEEKSISSTVSYVNPWDVIPIL